MTWSDVGGITTAFSLIAFAIAAITAIVRSRLRSRERQLLAAPESERPALVQAINDIFIVPSLPVDPQSLPPDKAYKLLLLQIQDRSRRFYVTSVLVAFLASLGTAVAIYALSRPSPDPERPLTEDAALPSTSSLRIRAYIDGRSRLTFEAGRARWCNLDGQAVPGMWEDRGEPTIINDDEFRPVWRFKRGNGCSEPFGPIAGSLPPSKAKLQVVKLASRGTTEVVSRIPLAVQFDDPDPAPDWYEVELRWR